MPYRTLSFIATAALVAASPQARAQGTVPCKEEWSKQARASQPAALALLETVSQLGSKLGAPVLTENLATTVAINNKATPREKARAIVDAQITAVNANTLADGLGRRLGDIYRHAAFFDSRDDGATATCGEISASVTQLIAAATATTFGDSAVGKMGFANGAGGKFTPPAGGILNPIGAFYGIKLDAPGGDKNGNPRPFQVARPDAASGPRIETFDGTDFFHVKTNSWILLAVKEDKAKGLVGSDLRENPSFPSGHTTFGYTESLLLALMVPERYRALVYRGSEYGESRIVLGAHYAIDVIGGRTLATYDIAQALAGKESYGAMPAGTFRAALGKAARDLRDALRKGGCPSIGDCALDPLVRAENASVLAKGAPRPAPVGEAYAFRLDYGLPAMGATDAPPQTVPAAATLLLETRFPYLDNEQRADILRSTQAPSGHFLDVDPMDGSPLSKAANGPRSQVGAYARLNLFAAAGGYTTFPNRVVIEQDADAITDPTLRPFADFARADIWSNDIGGAGGLTKRGKGLLTLAGENTYAEPTLIEGGTLEIAGSVRSSTNVESGTLAGSGRVADVFVLRGGTLAPGAAGIGGPMRIDGSLTMGRGSTMFVQRADDRSVTTVAGHVVLDDTALVVTAPLKPGQKMTLLKAKHGVTGKFGYVALDEPSLEAVVGYEADAVTLTVKPKETAAN